MRNLSLVDHRRCRVVEVEGAGSSVPTDAKLCVHPLTHHAYMVHTKGIYCLSQDPQDSPPSTPISWHQHKLTTKRVVSAAFVTVADGDVGCVVCVVMEEGTIVTLNLEDGKVDEVGEVVGGVAAAGWSPDQERVALITQSSNLLLMATDFDPYVEVALSEAVATTHRTTALGWGKKETQFHGSEGKAAATAIQSPTKPAPAWDCGRPEVTWRGDGELLAVSLFVGESRMRRVVVVGWQGEVIGVVEELDALEPPLAWKPSGGVMATTHTTAANKHEVAFVEKNGLKHGGFVLPFSPGSVEVVEVVWSPDSTVLAVWARPLQEGGKQGEVVQLWTTGNYHWYLKKEIQVGGGDEGREEVICMYWGEESPSPLLSLHLLSSTHHHHLTFLPTPHHSLGQAPQDWATAGVVDGLRLLLTPFRHTTVPPPMAGQVATFPEAINNLAFCVADPSSEGGDVDDSGFLEGLEEGGVGCNALCVQHGHQTITLMAPTPPDHPLAPPGCQVEVAVPLSNGLRPCVRPLGVLGQYRLEWRDGVHPQPPQASQLYHWAWPRRDTLVAVFSSHHACHLVYIEVQTEAGRAIATEVVPLEDWVVAIGVWPSLAVLQLSSGTLLRLDMASRTLEPFMVEGTEVKLPAPCLTLALCPMEGGAATLPVGLTPRGRLHLGQRQMLANCTSIHIHTHHLLATTSSHMLLALPLTPQGLAAVEEGGPGVRRVERGARIVLAVGHDTRVVLQMPRGNLEVVSPRPLAIHALARLLDTRQYGAAMQLATRHRIDTNLLYDHQPAAFLSAAQHFVRDIDDPQRIDVFLATLTPANTSATTYAFHYPGRPDTSDQGKVKVVCEAVRVAMVAVDEGRHLLPILTSLARAGQMEVALARVGEMHQLAEEGCVFPVGPEVGLRHLLYLDDAEELYRVALGTYDLSLALLVAQRCPSKDPQEYLPQLNGLRQLGEGQRRYRINVMLRRFHLALEELHDTAQHREEAMLLLDKEGLYPLALQLFPAKSDIKVAACQAFGRHLLAKNRPSEAAIMLFRARQYQEALEAYRCAGNWQMALVAAAKLGLAKEQVTELCQGLAEELRQQGRHLEAARLYEEHLANEEEAVECLTAAGEWSDALRVALKHGRPDLIETNVVPGALQQVAATREDVTDTAAAIIRQVARLAEVRVNREKQHCASLLVSEEGQLDCDLYSEASSVCGQGRPSSSSMASSSSSRSQRSSKSRRKLERKKYSTREGGPQEDLGLVAALHHTYTTLASRAHTVGALCTTLATLGHDGDAAALQEEFLALLKMAEGKKAEIWPPLLPSSQDQLEFGPQMTTEGAVQQVKDGAGASTSFLALRMAQLDPHLRHPPPPPKDTWQLGLLVNQYKGE